MKAGKLPTDIRLSFLQMLEKQQSNEKQARSSKDSRSKNQNDEGALSDDEQTKMLEAMKKSILESANLQQERLSNSSNKPSGPGGDDPIDEAHFEASLPTIPESNGESERNSEVVSPVENEDEGATRRGSVKSNKSNNDDDQQQVFKLTIENSNRNPFKNDSIGRLPFSGRKTESLVGKLSSDRINSLIAQNPFRKCFLFGDKNGVRDDLFKSGRQLPPEDFPKRRGNKVAFAEEDVNNNNVNNEQQPPSVTFQIPASNRSSDVLPFSSNEGGGGNARRKLCPGFLTQINELKGGEIVILWILKTSDLSAPHHHPPRRMDRREVGCGSSTLFQVAKTRNVCAQIGHSNLSGRNNEGGTQTVESSKTKMVRDEEVEPAGIYEGYQETFKSRETTNYSSDSSGSENSFPLPYNRNSYARRRRKHGRNKEYRHYEERRESRVEGSQQSPRYLNPPNQEMGYSGAHASESPRSNPNAGTFTRTINISTGRPPPPGHLPANQQQRQQQQQPNPQQPVFQRFIVNHNHPSANVIVRNQPCRQQASRHHLQSHRGSHLNSPQTRDSSLFKLRQQLGHLSHSLRDIRIKLNSNL
ncbi:hypothetical protein Ocin01_08933 [Orchesella cincta]|uniref:Uncharacterized protein n=1 Tax=Orchesella cincta TaxID=48709 RepID=A0A1D2MXI2_ORCCI|nr:hypothetical protein Ocin01_08933 [Orchesella cincta]